LNTIVYYSSVVMDAVEVAPAQQRLSNLYMQFMYLVIRRLHERFYKCLIAYGVWGLIRRATILQSSDTVVGVGDTVKDRFVEE
jgi:hypothetical protein